MERKISLCRCIITQSRKKMALHTKENSLTPFDKGDKWSPTIVVGLNSHSREMCPFMMTEITMFTQWGITPVRKQIGESDK